MKQCGPVVFYLYISLSSLMLFFTSLDSFKLPYPSCVQYKHTNYYKSPRALVIWEIIKWLHCIFLHWQLCFFGKHGLDLGKPRVHQAGFLCGRDAGGILWVTAVSQLWPPDDETLWLRSERVDYKGNQKSWEPDPEVAGRKKILTQKGSFWECEVRFKGEGPYVWPPQGSSQHHLRWTCKPATSLRGEEKPRFGCVLKGSSWKDRGDGCWALVQSQRRCPEALALCVSTSTCAPKHPSTAQKLDAIQLSNKWWVY